MGWAMIGNYLFVVFLSCGISKEFRGIMWGMWEKESKNRDI